jgi:hypothetical protein
MTSGKQLYANRANAEKSTGPRSQAGKDRSRLNSRKLGLTAKTLIMVGEHTEDFDQLRAGLMEEHDPQSLSEREQVERLAGISWRLRRVPAFEAAILAARLNGSWEYSSEPEPEGVNDDQDINWESTMELGRAILDDARYGDGLGKLARHETTLMNMFVKTLQMLLLLQDKRKDTEVIVLGAAALPPAEVDP